MRPDVFIPYLLRRFRIKLSFIIDGYVIFLSLCRTISYPCTMFVYNLCICFYFFLVYILYPVLSPTVPRLDLILSPSVSIMDSNYSSFKLPLTKFPRRSLVKVGSKCGLSMYFHPMITSINFTNRASCRVFIKTYASMCYVMQYAIEILLISTSSLPKR